jgi:hypothetical protein
MSGAETSRQQHVSSFHKAAVVHKRHAWGILGQSLTLRVSPMSAIIEPLGPSSGKASFELLLAQSSPPWQHESFWLVMAHSISLISYILLSHEHCGASKKSRLGFSIVCGGSAESQSGVRMESLHMMDTLVSEYRRLLCQATQRSGIRCITVTGASRSFRTKEVPCVTRQKWIQVLDRGTTGKVT